MECKPRTHDCRAKNKLRWMSKGDVGDPCSRMRLSFSIGYIIRWCFNVPMQQDSPSVCNTSPLVTLFPHAFCHSELTCSPTSNCTRFMSEQRGRVSMRIGTYWKKPNNHVIQTTVVKSMSLAH